MKNRKNILTAFIICALLLVGIGYATLTDTLQIDGTADGKWNDTTVIIPDDPTDPDNDELFDIEWVTTTDPTTAILSNYEYATDSLTVQAAYGADVEANATLTVTKMSVKGEKVSATYKFKNVSTENYKAEVKAEILSTNTKVNVSYFFNADASTVTLAPGEEATITVVVEMLESLLDSTNELNETITVKLTGTATE